LNVKLQKLNRSVRECGEPKITSASDSTSAVRRDTAGGTKHRAGTIKRLFRTAIKVITQHADTAQSPDPKRKRGKKEGGGPLTIIRRLLKHGGTQTACGRYAGLQPVRATSLLSELPQSDWDVFDITSLAYEHAIDDSRDIGFDTKSDHLSPGL
jgi:hypothetical protein